MAAIAGAVAPGASASSQPKIYWTNNGTASIGAANIDGTGVNAGLISVTHPFGLAVDGRHIYWANLDHTIGRSDLDGTNVNQSFITGSVTPAGVAVNGRHIYWADRDNGTIGEANLDGTNVDRSFITGASVPFAVAVDGQHIYWANYAGGSIGRANLDGTGVDQNFIGGAGANGVAVDGQHVYWANIGTNTIGRSDLDGTNVNQSFISGAAAPVGVAVDDQHIFWANDTSGTIGKANLDGTQVNQSFISDAPGPIGVAVAVPVATLSPAAPSSFTTTRQGSLSGQALTLTNSGQRPLTITRLSITGPAASDFFIGNQTCWGAIAPGDSCQLEVYFAPQTVGQRTATLQLGTNDIANGPLQVALSGTGASPSAGPTGNPGSAGPAGPAGSRGPAGPAGPAGKVICRNTPAATLLCTLLFGRGRWTTNGPIVVSFTLTRAHRVYAHGSITIHHAQFKLRLPRQLKRGHYSLRIAVGRGRHSQTLI